MKKLKLSLRFKITVILAVLAVVFFLLALISAIQSVGLTVASIEKIGTVEYTEESREKIDLAVSYYDALDKNLGLQNQVGNIGKLSEAKTEYVRLAIKEAYLADKNGEAEERVTALIASARAAYDGYLSESDGHSPTNYQDLLDLEEKYSSSQKPEENGPSDSDEQEGEEIDLC